MGGMQHVEAAGLEVAIRIHDELGKYFALDVGRAEHVGIPQVSGARNLLYLLLHLELEVRLICVDRNCAVARRQSARSMSIPGHLAARLLHPPHYCGSPVDGKGEHDRPTGKRREPDEEFLTCRNSCSCLRKRVVV